MPELLIRSLIEVQNGIGNTTSVANESDVLEAAMRLRSINITLDGDTPQHISHFHPTAKSARLLRSWLLQPDGSSSYFVVAPYGTGKSLTAAFFIHVVENLRSSSEVLGKIIERFSGVDDDLANELRVRVSRKQLPPFRSRGAAVALSGFQPHLPTAIKRSLIASLRRTGNKKAAALASRRRADSIDDVISLLGAVRDRYCPDPIDRLTIIWDEFGRHLEEIILRGTAADLSDVQTLAEFCARTKRASMTFALLLHQGLTRYAANTSVTVQREWQKIEGRFETVQFVDDSKELYQLVSRIVRQIRSSGPPARYLVERSARRCHEAGLFSGFSEHELERMLADSYPLEPLTLYLLPRVSARVAQNERTLFTYLNSLHAAAPVSPDSLYDYFSDAMRADTFPGGSYHNWLETEAALHSAGGVDEKTLKCACLLGLGLVGERSRVSRRLLECAVSGYREDETASDSVMRLIDAKLLLYRHKADSVSVWHGTDLDLRGRLEQEKDRLRPRFDHVSFLMSETPPAPWKPINYNVEYDIERSFDTRYVAAGVIINASSVVEALPPVKADGTLYVVVPGSYDETEKIRTRLAAETPEAGVIIALPRYVGPIAENALEVHALQLLRRDTSLLADDPLVESEITQMTDDAQGYLSRQIARMFQPSAEGPEYFGDNQFNEIASAKDLRQLLSKIMRKVYPRTPRIKNEMIVRRRPRPVIVNARKKLILAILERSGTENLGLEGYRPDMSMFRTVLLMTDLYRTDSKQEEGGDSVWRYAEPEELADGGLREVWKHLQDFLTVPEERPKPLAGLASLLSAAPYGIRAGIVPILLAAALRAFPGPISITRTNGEYVNDLLPSTIEAMAARPEEYQVLVPELTSDQTAFLDRVAALFSFTEEGVAETDPVRRCYDALVRWRSTLPHSALTSQYLSPRARACGRLMTTAIDPHRLLFDALPSALDLNESSTDDLLHALSDCKAEIDGVVHCRYAAAERAIRSAFPAKIGETATLRQVVGSWADFFPGSVAKEVKDGIARALITRARMSYDTDRAMVDALAALLVSKRIDRWEDSSVIVFERELGVVIRRVEDAVLSLSTADGVRNQSIVNIATSRLHASLRAIATVAGPNRAQTIVKNALEHITEEVSVNGSPARSA